ncbi:unnamed protein product [Gongylonema pulchrum]|uniref:Uncharacterized protein n=1 Tax=Gongylonema pulchrum TaxID=637853 RepID=A0A183DJQ7_9BILA|nr:unnamed protein product [Gongylonema pulchrum]
MAARRPPLKQWMRNGVGAENWRTRICRVDQSRRKRNNIWKLLFPRAQQAAIEQLHRPAAVKESGLNRIPGRGKLPEAVAKKATRKND